MADRSYVPLDVVCPLCHAAPGIRCRSLTIHGRPPLRRPHADRVRAAREAEQHTRADKAPATVTDAWTCPHPGCGRSYWPPREWEPEVWPVLRRLLQQMHGARHRREAEEAARHQLSDDQIVDRLIGPADE